MKNKHINAKRWRKPLLEHIEVQKILLPGNIHLGYELALHKGEERHPAYGMLGGYYLTKQKAQWEMAFYRRTYPHVYDGYSITRIYVDEHGFREMDEKDAIIEQGTFGRKLEIGDLVSCPYWHNRKGERCTITGFFERFDKPRVTVEFRDGTSDNFDPDKLAFVKKASEVRY